MHIQSKNQKLATGVLRMIELQRNGDTIDERLVRKVIESFGSSRFAALVAQC